MFDALSELAILQNCQIATKMYEYMEDQIAIFNDNCTYVTYSR